MSGGEHHGIATTKLFADQLLRDNVYPKDSS